MPHSFIPALARHARHLVAGALLILAGPLAAESFSIGGTGAATDILERLIEDFRKIDPATEIDIVSPPLGSSGGIRALIAGRIQMSVSGRRPNTEEAAGLHIRDLARSPLALASSGHMTPASLSRAEVAAIFAGTTSHWPNRSPIRLILRPASDSDNALIRSLSPDIAQSLAKALTRPGMVFAAHDLENAEMLSTAAGSLGTIPTGQIKASGLKLRPLALDGVVPSLDNLASGRYPIAKDFVISIRDSAPPGVRRFADYLFSARARDILRRNDFLPATR